MIVILGFGVALLLMKLTEDVRHTMAQKSLEQTHQVECTEIDKEYENRVRPIEVANRKIMQSWESANAVKAAEHAEICKVIDDENRIRLAPWEANKSVIEADYQRKVQEIERLNCRVLMEWEAENAAHQATYDQACRKIELENQRLTSAWNALTTFRLAEHRRMCDEIDVKNRQLITDWEAANSPWVIEQKRWIDRALTAEASIKRMEDELTAQRQATASKYQERKENAVNLFNSHKNMWQDYERDLDQAEMDSQRIQLEEHLDKSLIRRANLKGITGDRILSLESFGIETAKDITILSYQKVPGIGPILTERLIEWRDKIKSKFKALPGLPETEKRRIASRYGPALLPVVQTLQAAINDLEGIAASHRASESEWIKAVAAAVQEQAIAEANVRAYVRAMKVV